MAEDNIKYIIRVSNTDLDGKKHIVVAMTKIKGVGDMFANAVCSVMKLDKSKKAGTLTEAEVAKISEVIANPENYDIPKWMLNRRNDFETGEDGHLINADLKFTKDNDIKRQRKIKSYIGMRHAWALPTRGQRTKSNFRKNKGAVKGGVKKKK